MQTMQAATTHSRSGSSARAAVRFLRTLLSRPQAVAGTVIVLFFLLLAAAGPLLAPYGANDQSNPASLPPSPGYPFGTDYLGRDVFSRVILGSRSILLTAGIGTLIAVVGGSFIGLFIGYQGGLVDELVSRAIDAVLALPALLIALVIAGLIRNLDFEPGSWQAGIADNSVLLVIALVYIPIVARVVRSSTLDVRTREFVQAAQIRGESALYIIFSEILPSVIPTLVVEASLRFSYAIFMVASLGYLGVGARPPTPDWGLMVNQNSGAVYSLAPWALNFPAGAIAVLVVSVNLMSDGIRLAIQRGG